LAASTSAQYSGANLRAGATDGGNNFWGAGSAGGTYYFGTLKNKPNLSPIISIPLSPSPTINYKISRGDAIKIVQNLPEVKFETEALKKKGLEALITIEAEPGADKPTYTINYTSSQYPNDSLIRFLINAQTGEITIPDIYHNTIETYNQWKKTCWAENCRK